MTIQVRQKPLPKILHNRVPQVYRETMATDNDRPERHEYLGSNGEGQKTAFSVA
jgi:hypothetical protein